MTPEDTNKLLAVLFGALIVSLVTYALVDTIHIHRAANPTVEQVQSVNQEPMHVAQLHPMPFFAPRAAMPQSKGSGVYVVSDWHDFLPQPAESHTVSTTQSTRLTSGTASAFNPSAGALPIYYLPSKVYVPSSRLYPSQQPPVPQIETSDQQDQPVPQVIHPAVPPAAPRDNGLRLPGDQPLWLANLRLDPDGTMRNGSPVVGSLSGVKGLWLFDASIYNASSQPIYLVPDRLSFEDGSTELLFLRTNDWLPINGSPQDGNSLAYTASPANSACIELKPKSSTSFLLFAENGGAVVAPDSSDAAHQSNEPANNGHNAAISTAIGRPASIGNSTAINQHASGVNSSAADPQDSQSAPAPTLRQRYPRSLRFFQVPQPGAPYTISTTGTVTERLTSMVSIIKDLEQPNGQHYPLLAIPSTLETLSHFTPR